MNIGLIDIEPKIVNAAYMQISQYHKERGDFVGWWSPLEDRQFDHLYCSALFDFTDKREVPQRAICGGTGFDVTSRLSRAMEACDYDYSLYPKCDYSIVWFSRGCNRNCPFCVVRKKEGGLYPVKPKPLNPKGQYVVVQDNDFFANGLWRQAIDQLKEWNEPVDMQDIDCRAITDEQCKALAGLRHYRQIKIAWDNPREDRIVLDGIQRLLKYLPNYKVMCYVLIGYWPTEAEDLGRVEILRDMAIDPYVMPYNKKNPYEKRFARRVNHKAIFKMVNWHDYKSRCEKWDKQAEI